MATNRAACGQDRCVELGESHALVDYSATDDRSSKGQSAVLGGRRYDDATGNDGIVDNSEIQRIAICTYHAGIPPVATNAVGETGLTLVAVISVGTGRATARTDAVGELIIGICAGEALVGVASDTSRAGGIAEEAGRHCAVVAGVADASILSGNILTVGISAS